MTKAKSCIGWLLALIEDLFTPTPIPPFNPRDPHQDWENLTRDGEKLFGNRW